MKISLVDGGAAKLRLPSEDDLDADIDAALDESARLIVIEFRQRRRMEEDGRLRSEDPSPRRWLLEVCYPLLRAYYETDLTDAWERRILKWQPRPRGRKGAAVPFQ